MSGSILSRIYRGRITFLKENEEPRDVLIGVDLENQIKAELSPAAIYQMQRDHETLMGMKIEWQRAGFGISIRSTKGDLRIIPEFAAHSPSKGDK
jgi:hypothetical protein